MNPSKRDPWSMLQAELGLLSSPVEHEQVSMVSAVDPHDNAAQDDDASDINGALTQQKESEIADFDLPTTSETDDLFGFDNFGDCDIPKNAFASPKKHKPSREPEKVVYQPVEVPPQDTSETVAFVSANEPAEKEAAFDPLMSDELPNSLWQPRKQQISRAKTRPEKPSFPNRVSNQAVAKEQEWKSVSSEQESVSMPVDDLAKHSSGKKRQERGKDSREKFDDQRSSDRNHGESSNRGRREEPRRESPHPKYQHRKEAVPQASYNAPVYDDPDVKSSSSSFDDPAWEPKPKTSKGKDRKSNQSFRSIDDASFAFADRESQSDFTADLDRNVDFDKDWLDESEDTKKAISRDSHKNHKRKPSPEAKRNEEERETVPPPPSSRDPVTARVPRRSESPVAGVTTQKIAVPSWDDAVRDIIDKNMQRRPATKNERQNNSRESNSRGRGNRR